MYDACAYVLVQNEKLRTFVTRCCGEVARTYRRTTKHKMFASVHIRGFVSHPSPSPRVPPPDDRLATVDFTVANRVPVPSLLQSLQTFDDIGPVSVLTAFVVCACRSTRRDHTCLLVHCMEPVQRRVSYRSASLVWTSEIQPLQFRRCAEDENHTTQHSIS